MKPSEDTVQTTHDGTEDCREMTSQDASSAQMPEAVSVSDSLENLPVQLEVCLAEVGLSLSKFRTLTVGMTVPLDIDLTTKLDITVNGMKFGHGTLVQIGEKVGIQIEKWRTELEH